jgi:hypothetical protein
VIAAMRGARQRVIAAMRGARPGVTRSVASHCGASAVIRRGFADGVGAAAAG